MVIKKHMRIKKEGLNNCAFKKDKCLILVGLFIKND